ncbi:tRNA(Ile)-lysidine synthase [Onishia taeanensis]|uniref:tRNA(Ile)-lysidine synthase n=1 Tax=Onishia taeanensis TaxID=284577 RepID=A0A1G7P1M6_9GAMM|nr:tRNA lysidine(34) synthetase TilS [Halomonas taeanensis]SDF79997.1 tRNA(Ile)-lysidine synthase [Halomonas taeanensis]
MLEDVQRSIDDALAETPPGRCVWVALSGGLDSSLLLTLAARATHRHPRPLYALHVDHGLQAASAEFVRHCRRLCGRLGVPLFIERVSVDLAAGRGLEGAARQARYGAFAARLSDGDTLWLAQHRRDQAETWLLAALRGSGIRGLAAMPRARGWAGSRIARPLRDVPRMRLEDAAKALGVAWVEDPSNADEALDRNFLRRRVLPLLESRWPRAEASLARSATLAGEADDLLAELAVLDLAACGNDPGRLALPALKALSAPRRRLLIRYACQRLGLPTPPTARLRALEAQLTARRDAQVQVSWPGAEARCWRERLYLQRPLADLPAGWQVDWDGQAVLETPLGELALRLARCPAGGLSGESARYRVRARQGGEVLRLAERGRRDLKRLLQEASLPPWRRQGLLVVWDGDTVAAVLDPQQPGVVACAAGYWAEGEGTVSPAPGASG